MQLQLDSIFSVLFILCYYANYVYNACEKYISCDHSSAFIHMYTCIYVTLFIYVTFFLIKSAVVDCGQVAPIFYIMILLQTQM